MGDTVLKSGISYNKYVWHSSEGSCDACQALNGTEYEYEGDIPNQPHPNCQCYVEITEHSDGNGDSETEDGEPCDCTEQAEALLEELEEIVGDAASLHDEVEAEIDDTKNMLSAVENKIVEIVETLQILEKEYGQHQADCENNSDKLYDEMSARKWELERLIKDIYSLLNPFNTLLRTIYIFASNFQQLKDEEDGNMDKYYHAKANCDAAQLGILGSIVAQALSDFKEMLDYFDKVICEKQDQEEFLEASELDQVANRLGRERGRRNIGCDCSVLIWDRRPEEKR